MLPELLLELTSLHRKRLLQSLLPWGLVVDVGQHVSTKRTVERRRDARLAENLRQALRSSRPA